MKQKFLLFGITVALSALLLHGQETSQKSPFSMGLDIRSRFDVKSEGLKDPGNLKPESCGPHPEQSFDVRTRAWLRYELPDSGLEAKIRLTNRIKYFTSAWSENNNNAQSKWSCPDEVVFDEAYLRLSQLGLEGLSLKLGRQDVKLGNGMIIVDSSTLDSSRTVGLTGLLAEYETEWNTLKVFSFYDTWNDPSVPYSRWDKDRALRLGDYFTAGFYNTHQLNQNHSLDLYWIFNDVAPDIRSAKGQHLGNGQAEISLHTVGLRLFGTLPAGWQYSTELATQYGRWNSPDSHGNEDIQAALLDLRLRYDLGQLLECAEALEPVLNFQYLYASGDKDSTRKNEGWINLLAERDDVFGEGATGEILTYVYSNIHAFSANIQTKPFEQLEITTGSSCLLADQTGKTAVGISGSDRGQLIGTAIFASAGYKFNQYARCKMTLSHFMPGNYYKDIINGFWGRIELMLTF